MACYERFAGATDLGVDALTTLLTESFELFNTDELLSLLGPVARTLQEIPTENLESRGWRRRLDALKNRLGTTEESSDESRPLMSVLEEEERNLQRQEETPEEDPMARLQAVVRPYTEGRKALLVSNRKDTLLAEQIRADLDFYEVDLALIDPRRLQSAEEAILGGAYDFVLEVNGFLSHSADGLVSEACHRANTRLIRVGKGRPRNVLRVLARVLAPGDDAAPSPALATDTQEQVTWDA